MQSVEHGWSTASRHPTTALAVATAALALAAWAAGRWLGDAWRPVGLWPLGATLLGWLAVAPARLAGLDGGTDSGSDGGTDGGRRDALRSALRMLFVAAAAAALVVGAAEASAPGTPAPLVVAGGVLLPALAAAAHAWLSASSPARGAGSAELRLIATAVAFAPLGALVRDVDIASGDPLGGLADHLFGDLLAATVFAPMAAALAQGAATRLTSETPARPGANPGAAAALAVAAVAACAALALLLRAAGHGELARVLAVAHLLIGLQVARAVAGVPGALLIAANAIAMASTFASAFAPLVADDIARAREIATLLLLGGVFALMSVLQPVSARGREAARALKRRTLHSDLSGLPNQVALTRIVATLLDHPARTRFWLVGVVLPDIARWSDLTDGAAAADIERAVATRLRENFVPLGAKLAHPSSGRFVITLGDRVDAIGIRQKLRATLGGQRLDIVDHSIQLRYHAGIVEVPADATGGPDAVLTTLSMALQRAADDPAGVHRATVSAELLDDYRTELRMVEVVGRALDAGRVRLYAERMQPVSPAEADALHFEVLVRVLDDDGTPLQPKQFLPAIWHAGLHAKLDRLVFVRTVAYLARHRVLHDATRLCSINVCGPTLCDPEFPEHVKRCLKTYPVDPRRLMIEITESAAISDLELARAHVARLSDMGLAVALDDFGTGLATFDYLKRLRADVLKIDGTFIRRIVDDPLDREIVATIVRMAHATGARTVAEWIETPAQRDLVASLGVDYLQGHLVARPVPIEGLAVPRREDAPRVATAPAAAVSRAGAAGTARTAPLLSPRAATGP